MPNSEICNWNDIASDFRGGGLILGNGASIAVDDNFDYPSLFEKAREREYITDPINRIFEDLQTTDFEFVLRELWHSKRINSALNLDPEDKITDAYNSVKEALISTVHTVHENAVYESVKEKLKKASNFLSQFQKIFSLNYDLLVYWTMMIGNDDSSNKFKDGFTFGGGFNWETALDPGESTIVFYPHGNLIIGRHLEGGDFKICRRQQRRDLLSTITGIWREENIVPVFVSEGSKEQKKKTILHSPYLDIINNYFLRNIGEKVVIYGWSMTERDDHIVEAICKKNPEKFAVSLHTDNPEHTVTREKIKNKLRRKLGHQLQISFFDAQCEDCWIF